MNEGNENQNKLDSTSYSIQGIYYDAENIDGEISGSIKHRDLVSGEEQVIYSDINNPDIALSSLKTIALSDDLTAVLFHEATYNSDTGMDEYSFRVLGVNKEGQVTSSSSESLGSHQMSDNSFTIDSVEVIDESQLLIIGSRDNDETGNTEVFYGSYDFDLAEYVESGVISSIADNGDPATYDLSNYMQVNAEAGFAVYIKPGAGDDGFGSGDTLPSLVFRDLVSGQEQLLAEEPIIINPDNYGSSTILKMASLSSGTTAILYPK